MKQCCDKISPTVVVLFNLFLGEAACKSGSHGSTFSSSKKYAESFLALR